MTIIHSNIKILHDSDQTFISFECIFILFYSINLMLFWKIYNFTSIICP